MSQSSLAGPSPHPLGAEDSCSFPYGNPWTKENRWIRVVEVVVVTVVVVVVVVVVVAHVVVVVVQGILNNPESRVTPTRGATGDGLI